MFYFLVFYSWVVVIKGGGFTRLPDGMLNTRLDGSNPLNIDDVSLRVCVGHCELVTACLSINYNMKTRKCQLFNKTANDSIPLIYSSGDIHVTMQEWVKVQRSQCSSKPCPYHALCFPNGDSHVCDYPIPIIPGQTSNSSATSEVHVPTTQGISISTEGDGGSQPDGSNPLTTDSPTGETTSHGTDTTTEDSCTTFVMNDLPDTQLSVSSVKVNSSLGPDFYKPIWARLHTRANGTYHGGGWLAESNDQYQYIEVRFSQPSLVYALFIQGYNGMEAWMTEFKVLYSINCENYSYKLDYIGSPEIFTGTYGSDQTTLNVFVPPLPALCFRVIPVSWHNNIGLRLDIVACEIPRR